MNTGMNPIIVEITLGYQEEKNCKIKLFSIFLQFAAL